MSSNPWAQWPLSLQQKQNDRIIDPTSYPEYKALHDRAFLTSLTKEVRTKAVQDIRTAYKKTYNVETTDGVAIVLMGGKQADWELYCTDTDKATFRQESYFMHLFQLNEPDVFGIIDLSEAHADGEAVLAVPYLPESAARWNGDAKPLEFYTREYGMDKTILATDPATDSTTPIADELKARGITTVLVLKGQNSDSGLMTKTTAQFDGMDAFKIDSTTFLHHQLSLLQSIKTPLEVEYLRRACQMSARAHAFVMANIKPCMTELQCEALFQSYCMYYGGARAMAYTCICGSGPNGAVLHYGHAAHPNSRALQDGDMIVLDMGGEYNGYATDLTRSYPVNGKFTKNQATIFNIVRKAQLEVYAQIKPGACWRALHRLSERVIVEGLIEMGVLTGSVEQCMDVFMASLFLPHGLGHLLGLPVHGPGGYADCEPKSCEPGLCWLRLGRKLEAGMVVTVEPGLYFNKPWIMSQLEKKPEMMALVNMEELQKWFEFGGVRLEDDILVTADGYEMLTGEWPSTIEDIEEVCATFDKQ